MHNRFVRKQNQRDRNADPVIGAKTGTICENKLAIIYDLDRVLHRIEGYALCGHAIWACRITRGAFSYPGAAAFSMITLPIPSTA